MKPLGGLLKRNVNGENIMVTGAGSSIPSKFLAYMFSSKPILASVDRGSDTALAINKGECGWVVDPENIELLSNLMKSIINLDKKDLESLGSNGRLFALENFSKKSNLPKLVNIISQY